MKYNLGDVFQAKNLNKQMGKLLHFGAGAGVNIKDFKTINFAEIICYEAGSHQFSRLKKQYGQDDQVHLFNSAVVADPSTNEVEFQIYLPFSCSTIKPISGLEKFYPNLQLKGSENVSAVSVKAAIEKASLSEDRFNVVIFDVPFDSVDLLPQLANEYFSTLDMVILCSPQYSGDVGSKLNDQKNCVDLLKDNLFKIEKSKKYGPFSYNYWYKDESLIELDAYKKRVIGLSEQGAELSQRYAEQELALQELEDSNELLIKDLESSTIRVEELTKAIEIERQHKEAAESEQSTLYAKHAAANKRVEELMKAIEIERQHKEAAESEQSTLHAQDAAADKKSADLLMTLEQEITAKNKVSQENESLDGQVVALKAAQEAYELKLESQADTLEFYKKQIGEQREDIKSLNNNNELLSKLSAKMEHDKNGLQEVIAEKNSVEKEMVELIARLRQQLSLFAGFEE